ncbi:hypothetical protein ACJMK2_004136 [Sinanodonta woodiana]|uniref:Uncharacterized protein n=1 Tax=Sinanodonta woodiana TaxID=1069815 RepID=A0ABD3Y099_SINWO
MYKTCTTVGCENHNMMGMKLSFFTFPKHVERQKMFVSTTNRQTRRKAMGTNLTLNPDHSDYVPSVFEYAKRYTTYVQQNKMVRYGNKVKQIIEFESIATSSKKVKKSTEKLNTAVLGSPTPTQQTPQKNTSGTSTISPWGGGCRFIIKHYEYLLTFSDMNSDAITINTISRRKKLY